MPEYISENITYIVKIESNIKLNLIDQNGNSMIKNEQEEEIHFMNVEFEIKKKYLTKLGFYLTDFSKYF